MTEQTQTDAVPQAPKVEPKAKRQSGILVTLIRELHADEKMPAQGKIVYEAIKAKYGINAPFAREDLIDLLEPRAEEFKTRQTVERIVVFYLNDFKAKRNLVTLTKAAGEPKVVTPKAVKPAAATAPETAAQASPENKGGTKAPKTAVKDAAA